MAHPLHRAILDGDIYASYDPDATERPKAVVTVLGTFSTIPHHMTATAEARIVADALGFTQVRDRRRVRVNGMNAWQFTLDPADISEDKDVNSLDVEGYPYALTFARGKAWSL